MLGWVQTIGGKFLSLAQELKETILPFIIDRSSCILNSSASEISKIALRRWESASSRISIEWGYVMPIKEVKSSRSHRLLAEFAIDSLKSS